MPVYAGSKDTGAHITNADMDYAIPSDLSFACKPGNQHEDTTAGTSQDYFNVNPGTSQSFAGEFPMGNVQPVRAMCCVLFRALQVVVNSARHATVLATDALVKSELLKLCTWLTE
jgi:hypothetical protein